MKNKLFILGITGVLLGFTVSSADAAQTLPPCRFKCSANSSTYDSETACSTNCYSTISDTQTTDIGYQRRSCRGTKGSCSYVTTQCGPK